MENDSVDPYHDDDTFPCKSKICMVCKSIIVDDNGEEDDDSLGSGLKYQIPRGLVCLNTFLKGISILCDALNIEPKYATCEEWSEVGVDDFVRIVCCADCYKLFRNIVALHDLIISTQESLRVDVHKIKHCILQSQETAEDVEYFVSTCLKFRDHILKDSQKSCQNVDALQSSSTGVSKTKTPNSNIYHFRKRKKRAAPRVKTPQDLSNICIKSEPFEVTEFEFNEHASGSDSVNYDEILHAEEEGAEIDTALTQSKGSKQLSSHGRPRASIREEFNELESGKVECMACSKKVSNRTDVMKDHKRICTKNKKLLTASSIDDESYKSSGENNNCDDGSNNAKACQSQGRPRDPVRDEFKELALGKVQCLSCLSKVSNRVDVMKGHKRICNKKPRISTSEIAVAHKPILSPNSATTTATSLDRISSEPSEPSPAMDATLKVYQNKNSHHYNNLDDDFAQKSLQRRSQGRPRDLIRDKFKELASGKVQCLSCLSKISNRSDVMKAHKRVCRANTAHFAHDTSAENEKTHSGNSKNSDQSNEMSHGGLNDATEQEYMQKQLQGRPRGLIREEFKELVSGKVECLACSSKISNRTDVMKAHKRVCGGILEVNSSNESKTNIFEENITPPDGNSGEVNTQSCNERNSQGRPRDLIRKKFRELASGKVECLTCFTKVSNRTDVMKGHNRICTGNRRTRLKSVRMRRPKIVRKSSTMELKSENLFKRKRGRPRSLNKSIVPGGSKRSPIFVIDDSRGVFMFLSVKFQIEHTSFVCKHPDCNFSIPIKGYFADQTTFNSMQLHIKDFHRFRHKIVDESRKKYHCCCHCDMQFTNGKELLAHRKNVHSDASMPLTLCEICGDVMRSDMISGHLFAHKSDEEKTSILEHKPEQRVARKMENKISSYSCNQCGKMFRTKSQQQVHKLSHIPIELRRQIICDICGARVSSVENLRKHKSIIHFRAEMPTPFKCHICGKAFFRSEKSRYHAHLNSHTGERPFQCTECGKSFTSKKGLWIHEKTHEQTLVHCEFCPKVYKNSIYLNRHQKSHHIALLPKSFTSFYSPKHQETFIGPKLMHPCEPCGRTFKYKSLLVKHLKEKHRLFLGTNDEYPSQMTLEDL